MFVYARHPDHKSCFCMAPACREHWWGDVPQVKSGVRPGCPLSPLLFALCADLLQREISNLLADDKVARAFAADTAAVIQDYVESPDAVAPHRLDNSKFSTLKLMAIANEYYNDTCCQSSLVQCAVVKHGSSCQCSSIDIN
jgi:hypothetical protein